MKIFDYRKFKKSNLSTIIDGNYVGEYENLIVRIIKENIEDYKEVIKKTRSFAELIESEIFYEDENVLVLKHKKLRYITYPIEWTEKQKIEAICSVIDLQRKLDEIGYHLKDPHAFNITYEKSNPIYLDFGSITKGRFNTGKWIKHRLLLPNQRDCWDYFLNINRYEQWWILIRISISHKPLIILKHLLLKHIEKGNKLLKYTSRIKPFFEFSKKIKILRYSLNYINNIFFKDAKSRITNWTYYQQNNTVISSNNSRKNNFILLLNKYKPNLILDIGANKGAYSKLALKYGVKEAICIDVDSYSLDILREEIKNNNLHIWTARMDIMNYNEKPGHYESYLAAHLRFRSKFVICFAIIHHLCYFGSYSFEQFAETIEKFAEYILIVEFVPYSDIHLNGPYYKGKDKLWYTQENFIVAMKKYFKKAIEIFDSTPNPRVLIKFEK